MNRYTIYFEIYGKKMKTIVFADTEAEAKQKVIARLIFHKVEKKPDDAVEHLKRTFGMN